MCVEEVLVRVVWHLMAALKGAMVAEIWDQSGEMGSSVFDVLQ